MKLIIELEGDRDKMADALKEIARRVEYNTYYYNEELDRYLKQLIGCGSMTALKKVEFGDGKVVDHIETSMKALGRAFEILGKEGIRKIIDSLPDDPEGVKIVQNVENIELTFGQNGRRATIEIDSDNDKVYINGMSIEQYMDTLSVGEKNAFVGALFIQAAKHIKNI